MHEELYLDALRKLVKTSSEGWVVFRDVGETYPGGFSCELERDSGGFTMPELYEQAAPTPEGAALALAFRLGAADSPVSENPRQPWGLAMEEALQGGGFVQVGEGKADGNWAVLDGGDMAPAEGSDLEALARAINRRP